MKTIFSKNVNKTANEATRLKNQNQKRNNWKSKKKSYPQTA